MVDVFLVVIVRCDAFKNYMFHTYSQVVGLWYREVIKNCMHLHIPHWYKVEQPDALQHNMINFETEI